jgi:hypothetical protein
VSDEWQNRLWQTLLWVLFLISYPVATAWVGYLFGYITGASLSPIGATVAPLVMGLLAVLGLSAATLGRGSLRGTLEQLAAFKSLVPGERAALQAELGAKRDWGQLFLAAAGVWIFCSFCHFGLMWGIYHRKRDHPPAATAPAEKTDRPTPLERRRLRGP